MAAVLDIGREKIAILNLNVISMRPIKCLSTPIYDLGGGFIIIILRLPSWQPPRISERNNFSNPECLCRSDASN